MAAAPALDPAVLRAFANRAEEATKPIEVPGWNPQPKQALAQELASSTFETLYGGAAFGGKSYFLSNYAVLQSLKYPNTIVGIVRKNLNDIERTHGRNLMAITADIPGVRYNGQQRIWRFPNGSQIWYVSLPHTGSEQDYKSVQFDVLLFDEVTELPEDQYTYMVQTRVRSGGKSKVKPHVIGASNPEGFGYAWVKRRFVKPKPGDLAPGQEMPQPLKQWRPPLPGRSGRFGRTRVYVPATIYDNPAGMAADPEYITSLEGLPDARKRKALLEGDWDAMDQVPGALWSLSQIEDDRVAGHPDLVRKVVAIDPAGTTGPYSDSTGIIAVGRDLPGQVYVLADRSGKYEPGAWARAATQLYLELGANYIVIEKNAGAGTASLLNTLQVEFRAMQQEGLLDHTPMVEAANAQDNKWTRAEPVATLYRKHHVHHVGEFPELEEQLTTWLPSSGYSPDRMDALVWAISYLANPVPVKRSGFARTR